VLCCYCCCVSAAGVGCVDRYSTHSSLYSNCHCKLTISKESGGKAIYYFSAEPPLGGSGGGHFFNYCISCGLLVATQIKQQWLVLVPRYYCRAFWGPGPILTPNLGYLYRGTSECQLRLLSSHDTQSSQIISSSKRRVG